MIARCFYEKLGSILSLLCLSVPFSPFLAA